MQLRDSLRERIKPIFVEFASRVSQAAGMTVRTEFSSNDAFVLRAFINSTRIDDNEVALVVNVRIDEGVLSIESDICRDDGYIYKDGPSKRSVISNDQEAAVAFDQWLVEFKEYLTANETYYVSLLR